MKYVRDFNNFKSNRDSVNEEFIGGLMNWFKGLWKKAVENLKKLGDDPSTEDLRKWVDDNPFNSSSESFLFKSVLDEFKKEPSANNEKCLEVIDKILDPESGTLGKSGLQPLYDNLLQAFGKDNVGPLETIKFIMETIRNRAIKDYKYAGGPDFKVGQEAKIDPNAKKMDLTDTTHLPDFKKVLQGAGQDDKNRKELSIGWIEKTLMTRLDKYASEVTDQQVQEYLKSKNIKSSSGGDGMTYDKLKDFYDKKTPVIYKLKGFNQANWDKLTDEEKKNPEKEPASKLVGVKTINAIDDQDTDQSLTFLDKDDNPTIKKGYKDIIGPSEEKADGQEDLVKTLSDLKTKNPEAIKKMSTIANLYNDPEANKDKIAEIEKQLREEQK
jgi:hypothetical protein